MWHNVGTVGVNPSCFLGTRTPKLTAANLLASQARWIFKDEIVVPVADEHRKYHLVDLIRSKWKQHDAMAPKKTPESHLYRLRWWTAAVMETLRWAGGDKGLRVLQNDELVVHGIGDVQLREQIKDKGGRKKYREKVRTGIKRLNRGKRGHRGRRDKQVKEGGKYGKDDNGGPPLVFGAGTGGMPIDLENAYYWEAKLQYFRKVAVQLIDEEQIWIQEAATLRDGRWMAGALMEEWQRLHPEERDLQVWLHLKGRSDLTREDKLKLYNYQCWAMDHSVYGWEDVVKEIHLWRATCQQLMDEDKVREDDKGKRVMTEAMVGSATETEGWFQALDETKAKLLALQEDWALPLRPVKPDSSLSRPASFVVESSS